MEQRFVLDTSLFTNPDVFSQFDSEPQKAIAVFAELALAAPARFYMPVSVFGELCNMRDLAPHAGLFQAAVRLRSPRRFSLSIPAAMLYDFIDEMRSRVDKGLKVAEEWLRRAGEITEEPPEVLVTKLRERFRVTMRQGIIDSKEDMDVLLLALELEAALVSADGGLRTWADKAGIELADCQVFRKTLEALIEHKAPLQKAF